MHDLIRLVGLLMSIVVIGIVIYLNIKIFKYFWWKEANPFKRSFFFCTSTALLWFAVILGFDLSNTLLVQNYNPGLLTFVSLFFIVPAYLIGIILFYMVFRFSR